MSYGIAFYNSDSSGFTSWIGLNLPIAIDRGANADMCQYTRQPGHHAEDDCSIDDMTVPYALSVIIRISHLAFVSARCVWHLRELPVETEHDSLQTPDVAHIPDPVHESQFGADDHVGHLALWD